MAVFNPPLRMFMLLSNVYDTYKVLKVPIPHRGQERPSTRAITQRKRDMKGCLAVWIVWTCFLMYERLVERIVCMFIPFYSELKMVFVIFLTLTKARVCLFFTKYIASLSEAFVVLRARSLSICTSSAHSSSRMCQF